MAEESVRIANDAVARALESVTNKDREINERIEDIKQWKKKNPYYMFNERLKLLYEDKQQELKEARESLREARESLKEANDRLKEAREYHLRLTQSVQPALETQAYNALVEKIDMLASQQVNLQTQQVNLQTQQANLHDIIQTRLPTSNSSFSFSSRALGQMVMKRIAKNFSKHSPTEGNPILTKVEQMAIQPNILEKELVVEMTKHFNRILPQTGYPLVFVNSEDFGWLEQHPDVSRKTDMKPDGFVTFQGLFCHREKQECPAGCNFGIPFAKLLDSIVIVKAKRVIDDGALGEVSTPLIRH
jgi:hypothetical protein